MLPLAAIFACQAGGHKARRTSRLFDNARGRAASFLLRRSRPATGARGRSEQSRAPAPPARTGLGRTEAGRPRCSRQSAAGNRASSRSPGAPAGGALTGPRAGAVPAVRASRAALFQTSRRKSGSDQAMFAASDRAAHRGYSGPRRVAILHNRSRTLPGEIFKLPLLTSANIRRILLTVQTLRHSGAANKSASFSNHVRRGQLPRLTFCPPGPKAA